jgi:hypothetical protein
VVRTSRQLGVVPGLGEEVGGAGLHAAHRQRDRAPGRHQQHRQRRLGGADIGQQLQAFLAAGLQREVHVLQHQVDRARAAGQRLLRVVGAHRVVARLLEQQGQRHLHRAVVIDN